LGFPTKDGDSDFTKIEKGNYGDIAPINQIMLLSLLGYGGYRFHQWWKSGNSVFGDGGEIPSFRSGGDIVLLAGLLGGIGGNFLSDIFRGPGSYFGRPGDAGIFGGISGAASYMMLSSLFGTKTNNTDQTKALLLAGLLGYGSTPFDYSSSSMWSGYGRWDGVSGSEMGKGGSVPSFGLGGQLETIALLFALLGGYTGYKGSQLYGPWTGSTVGDVSLGFFGGLLPFFLGTNLEALRGKGGSVPSFGNGGSIPSFGIGDYLGWLWPGNWLPDGPKKGKVYHPFLATPYKGISGSSWLPWNWFDDDVKGPDTSTLAKRDWYEALVYYGNIFNWFGKGGSIPEAGMGMGLFGLGTASIGAMSILADAGMLPGNAIFSSPLGSRQNKGSAGSQALTAAQAISWALGSIGLFSSMQGGKRSGEMGLLSLLLMGLGSTGFKSGGKSYLNPATWAGTQKYNRSKFGLGGSIPSFESGGKSNSGMRRFGDSPGLDLLSSLLMMGIFNELYQGQVKKGSGKNSTSSILQLIGLLGVGLSGYGTFKSLTSGNWMVGGMSGSLPYLLKDKPVFGSGGSIPSFGVGDWLFGEDTPRRKPNPGLDLLTSLILMSGSNQLYKEQVSKGSGKNNKSRLLQLLGLLGTGYFAYDSFKNLTSGNWMFGGKSGSLGYLSPKFGKGGKIPSLGLGNSPGLSLFGSLIGLALSNQIYREQVSKGSKKNNNSRLLQLLGLLGTGYFTYDSFKSLTSGNWMFGGKSGSLGYLLKDRAIFGSGGDIPSFDGGRGVGSSNVLDWLWPWDTKGSIDSLFDWSSRGIANASMDFLDLGWWGRNFSLWSWLDFGNGGSIPSFKTAGSLLELLGKNRRKSAFERGFFEPSAMGDVSRSRVIPGRGKRNNSWGFLEYLMLTLGIGGLGAIISNNKKLFGFGTGGSLQAGGVARGPSHQSGMVGYAKGGMPFLFEGGEYIIRKDSVDKLGVPILDMLNSGMFSMGRGGRIPSYQTGTTVAPTNMMESLLLARRDLFGLQKITRTTDSGDIEEVYVANVSEISGGSSSNTELLSGISELLSSLLVTTKVQQKIIGENGLEIMEEQLKFSTLAVETAFGTQLALQDYTSNIFSVATEEQAKALTDAGIAPGMLLRVSLDFIGNAAFAQLASLLPRGGGPSFDDRLLDIIIQGALQYGIAQGGIGMTGAAIAALGLERGRSTAEEGKQDLSTAAGLAALVGLSAAGAPAWVTVAATVIAAEVIGKPENYFAEIGFDEQMDLQEPVQGLYDELFNQNDGAFTYPAKYVDTLFKERIPDVQKRLDEGTMRMNMNSQKLASAMERAFDLDEGSLQFDAIGGLSETYGSVESLSKIGDRLKELEDIVAPQVQELIEGIRYIVEYPAEFFKNFGNQLDKFFKGSLGELFSVIFGIPLQIADLFEKTLKQNIGIGLQEFTKNSLALFLAIAFFPVTLTMLATGKIGENVDQFLTNFVIFTGAIALLPVTLTMAIVAANSEFVVKFAESFNNTVLGGILNIPGNSLKAILDLLVPTFLGSFTGIFDSFLGEILMIPNMLLQETINFVTALPGRLLKMFGIEFPFFELNALKNPFHGNLGGPEYLIDLEIGEKSEGDGGLINYGRGGVLQTGGLAVGPSHQSGMLGLTNQGTPFLFEGGEYIVNKKTTDLLGHDFMAGINAVKSDEDLKDVFSVLSMFQSGGDLFDLGMNDNPLSSVFTIPNPLKSLTGPDEFNISIDPSEDLSGIDVEQNLFKNGGGLFDIAGNVFGNSFEKDFLSVDNPFRKAITFVERYQREVKKYGFLGRVVARVLEWATRTVTKLVPLGPDTLKLGIDGNSLDFYNSKLTSNFGGDVLNKLGIDSLPTPSMENGGMVFGPSHGMGGVLAELEGGEYVMNRDSVSDLGYGFMSDLNSGGSGFTSSLIRTSSMNNQLLSRLIEVVEQKEMSVTVLDTSGEEKSDSNIRISRDREMNYRGARMLA